MKKIEWQSYKKVIGSSLIAVYASQLHVNEDLTIFASEFLLKFRNPITLEFWYWHLKWFEDEELNDYLIINEQETPKPLEYVEEPLSTPEHIIIGSLFHFEDKCISKVSGYGYKDTDGELLTKLLFEFEESYLVIKTGPLIEVKYLKEKPNQLGDLLFICD